MGIPCEGKRGFLEDSLRREAGIPLGWRRGFLDKGGGDP